MRTSIRRDHECLFARPARRYGSLAAPLAGRHNCPRVGRAARLPLPSVYPRLHFDLHVTGVAEQEAEAARLESLGATRVDWDSYPDDPEFIVLADPEGNRLCIVDLAHEDH